MARRFREINEITINGTHVIQDFIDEAHNINFNMLVQYDEYKESFILIADKYLNKLQDMYKSGQITKGELEEGFHEISGFYVNPVNEKYVDEINSLDFDSNSYIEDVNLAVKRYKNTVQFICKMEDMPYERFAKSTSNIERFANKKINEKENDIISRNLDDNDKIVKDEDWYNLRNGVLGDEDELENENVNVNDWEEILLGDEISRDYSSHNANEKTNEIGEDDWER